MLDDNLEQARTPPTLKGGRYIIAGVLGKGGNAGVYQAWDTKLRTWRAIKVLSHEFIKDDQVRARFAQEAATMARLDHRNLVQVYDISDDPFTPHIVMELCGGGSIIQWMKVHGAVPPRLALHVIESVARGVAIAHAENITHRDIKPQNILIDHKGIIKLTDFGIARDEDNSLTMAGATMGTYAFMAPEQRHDSTQVDVRADIYSLGATLFTLTKVKTTTELFVAEADDPLFQGLPEPIVELILTCCAYKPRNRFQDVDELLAGIEDVRARLPADPSHPPLEALAQPLPAEPPADLPDFAQLEDLLKSLALNDDTPTYMDRQSDIDQTTLGGTSKTPLPERRVLPYYMDTTGAREPTDPGRYVDTSYIEEPAPSRNPVGPQIIGSEGTRAHTVDEEPDTPEREELDPRVWMALAGAVALLLITFVGAVGIGTSQVNAARQGVIDADGALLSAVQSSAPAIQEVEQAGGDGRTLQETYFKVTDAEDPARRTEVALAYAHDLAAEADGRQLSGAARGLVDAVANHAAKAKSAREKWREASEGLTGGMAVTLGLASGPG